MFSPRYLALCLIPLLAACQNNASAPSEPNLRIQGLLSFEQDQLRIQPCDGTDSLLLQDPNNLLSESFREFEGTPQTLFADIAGHANSAQPNSPLQISKLYRLTQEGFRCKDPDFRQLIIRASGNEPFWSIRINKRGLLLDRPGEQQWVLPYLEERLGNDQLNISSEANGQTLELWLSPQRCVDSMSGAISHLSAQLRINGQVLQGCAAYGGLRR